MVLHNVLPLSKSTAQIFLKLKKLKHPSKASGIDNVIDTLFYKNLYYIIAVSVCVYMCNIKSAIFP